MTLRAYLERLETEGRLRHVRAPVSRTYEIAGILKKLEPEPVLFDQVKESPFRVVGNLFCGKSAFADYFRISPAGIIPMLSNAIENRRPPQEVRIAPCQEVVETGPDLDRLPILRHCAQDGGITSVPGIYHRHPQWAKNIDFLRCMRSPTVKRRCCVALVISIPFERAQRPGCRQLRRPAPACPGSGRDFSRNRGDEWRLPTLSNLPRWLRPPHWRCAFRRVRVLSGRHYLSGSPVR